jgi:hypothetical protein
MVVFSVRNDKELAENADTAVKAGGGESKVGKVAASSALANVAIAYADFPLQ